MNQIKQLNFPVNFCVLFSVFFLINGCATTELTSFKKNIKSMADDELVSCYYGINERIKDIDNIIEREERLDHFHNQNIISNQSYFVGGEIFGLMQKEKVVLEELKRRKINP